MVGIGKRLYHAMIRDGNRRMSPLISPLHDILGFRYPVHIAHFGMAVQLHPFAHAVIHTAVCEIADFLDAYDGTYGQFPRRICQSW